jgi:Mlc titration factor MtfA (ptsG expression regulator)
MLFPWLRRLFRPRVLAQPFPAEWLAYLEKNVALYRTLNAKEQARLRNDIKRFVREKNWEGCGGLEITDEIKVTVAAQACLLRLGLENHDCYRRVRSILVYPHGFQLPVQMQGTEVIYDDQESAIGEAVYRGPVILSWEHVIEESRQPRSGKNVVIHEFAHQLDMLNGQIDGTPPLGTPEQSERWARIMQEEFDRLVDSSDEGRATLLDQYGATDEGEFFAVASEFFFTRPLALRRRHRHLYKLLREYYRQDPARRARRQQELDDP